MTAVLDVRDLHVAYGDDAVVLDAVGLNVNAGECLAVLGESGSGKSTLARAVMGLLPESARWRGTLCHDGMTLDAPRWRVLRGTAMAMVFQDAAASLNPLRRVGDQLAEALRRAGKANGLAQALQEVGLDDVAGLPMRYPHQLSGGQRQRVLIALALAGAPQLLIADEVTSALDPLAAAGVLDLLDRLRRERGLALLFISHDLHAVRRLADRVLFLQHGQVEALVDAKDFFAAPPNAAAAALLAAARIRSAPDPVEGKPIVRIDGLQADHGSHPALRDVGFSLPRGAALGVIGASGSGKSTLARVLLALQRGAAQQLDIAGANPLSLGAQARKAWRHKVQIVFQDPGLALDPRMRVADSIEEPLRLHGLGDRAERARKVRDLLERVRLRPELATRLPHQLSGGQKQRVAIARALALQPEVLVCDEATSALDLSVQAEILDLLRGLQRDLGLSLIFISHDLNAVRGLCDRIVVLKQGRVVEQGETRKVLAHPSHPETRALLRAMGSEASTERLAE